MPLIHISLFPLEKETRRELARDITEAVLKHIPCPPEAVQIAFHEAEAEYFSGAGELLQPRKKQ